MIKHRKAYQVGAIVTCMVSYIRETDNEDRVWADEDNFEIDDLFDEDRFKNINIDSSIEIQDVIPLGECED